MAVDTQQMERILKAMANRRRLNILQLLKKDKEATVINLARQIKLSYKSTSRHLAVLRSTNIVEREQRLNEAYYRIAKPHHEILSRIYSML